ncbi:MAG TPA: hypothetical protein VK063_05920 [Beutenbergiaceae bacterium]|nr:hypothetical protein [Beutenbergiaceae bacterium]
MLNLAEGIGRLGHLGIEGLGHVAQLLEDKGHPGQDLVDLVLLRREPPWKGQAHG